MVRCSHWSRRFELFTLGFEHPVFNAARIIFFLNFIFHLMTMRNMKDSLHSIKNHREVVAHHLGFDDLKLYCFDLR